VCPNSKRNGKNIKKRRKIVGRGMDRREKRA
jgi:hypothetical protein